MFGIVLKGCRRSKAAEGILIDRLPCSLAMHQRENAEMLMPAVQCSFIRRTICGMYPTMANPVATKPRICVVIGDVFVH